MKAAISPHDLELLSAYIDQQLKPAEYARLRVRLQTEPELVATLKSLQTTRRMLRSLPIQRAPRNFTLTPAMAGIRPAQPAFLPALRLASVLAAVLLVFVIAGDYLGFLAPGTQSRAVTNGGAEVAMQYADGVEVEAVEAAAEEPPLGALPEVKTSEVITEEVVAMALPPDTTPAPAITDTARVADTAPPPTEETLSITGENPLPLPTATLPPIPTFTPTVSIPPTATLLPPPSAVPIPSRTPEEIPAPWVDAQPPTEEPNQAQQALTIIEASLAVVAIVTGLAAIFLRRGAGK